MLNKLIVPVRLLFLIIFTISLYGCGEDTSARKPIDTIAPLIIATVPESEAINVALSSKITINFSKNISDAVLDNITFIELISNKVVRFTLSTRSNIIEITPVTNLMESKQYQVSVSGVKNTDGTVMDSTCTWKFQTVNAIANPDLNLTGVCGSAPEPVPNAVENVTAIVTAATTIEVSWQAPSIGSDVTHYRIEKSTADSPNFISLKEALNETQFIDTNAITDVAHIYKITAGNGSGYSASSVTSLPTTPTATTIINGINILVSPQIGVDNHYGHAIRFTRDGTLMAITELRGSRSGTVHLYSQNTLGQGWTWNNKSLVTNVIRDKNNSFGHSLDFSPDDSILAIAEIGASVGNTLAAGTVHFYDRTNSWAWSFSIISNNPMKGNLFGYSVHYSPDGNTLAVGEIQNINNPNVTNDGSVQLFSKNPQGLGWTWQQTLKSKTPATGNLFGIKVRFSPNGTSLAIAEMTSNVGGLNKAGSVQIFKKDPNNPPRWFWSQTLTPSLPASNNYFGNAISFSSDAKTLAVGEYSGDTNANTDVGLVHLYRDEGTLGWINTQILTSNKPINGLFFGFSLGFNADDSTLAIGELKSFAKGIPAVGTVQLFSQIANVWQWDKTLHSSLPKTGDQFGFELRFSPKGSSLAATKIYGDRRNSGFSGTVNVFDLTNLPIQ